MGRNLRLVDGDRGDHVKERVQGLVFHLTDGPVKGLTG